MKCPTPTKGAYFTREAAEHKLKRIWAQIIGQPRQKRDIQPCRTYQCECGMWHLSSKPLWPGQDQP